MFKKVSVKLLALALATVMLAVSMPLSVFATGSVTNYADFMTDFKQLEVYADAYAAKSGRDVGELILNFIRTGHINLYAAERAEGIVIDICIVEARLVV